MINMNSNASHLLSDLKNQLFELENYSSALKKKVFELEEFIGNYQQNSRVNSELNEAKTQFSQFSTN